MTPEILLGPPGTGKTSALLDGVNAELAAGTAPERIGFVTFTKRAATEASTRAAERFGFTRSQLRWFRTLHSLCFEALGIRKSQVFEGAKVGEFARWVGLPITGSFSEDGTLSGYATGDRCMHVVNLARVRCRPLAEEHRLDDRGMPWRQVEHFARSLEKFKEDEGLYDFSDMLIEFARAAPQMGIDVLFVDEMQDQSALQWRVVETLSRFCRRVVYAGDDDQAIYRWAGADVDHMMQLRGDARVLGTSYRVPRKVQQLAMVVLRRVHRRLEKEWAPRDSDGEVSRVGDFRDADLAGQDILVLSRNAFALNEIVEPWLKNQGVIFERNGRLSVSKRVLLAVTAWEALRAGKQVTVEEARAAYEMISSGVGVKRGFKELKDFEDGSVVGMQDLRERGGLLRDDIWHDALDRLSQHEKSYLLAARRRGERLARPRVRVSTIHSAKGGEADHVVLLQDMAWRTRQEMDREPDDEARVWYVAATRARSRLTVVRSQAKNHYDI